MSTWMQPINWERAMRRKRHEPIMSTGLDGKPELDYWAWSDNSGYHNGPKCSKCGWSCCWHCETIKDIPECV